MEMIKVDDENMMGVRKIRKPDGCRGVVHKIEKGDTLYLISRKYGVKLKDLIRENPYVDVYNLQIGDEICVPIIEIDTDNYIVLDKDMTVKELLAMLKDVKVDKLFNENPELYQHIIKKGTMIKKN